MNEANRRWSKASAPSTLTPSLPTPFAEPASSDRSTISPVSPTYPKARSPNQATMFTIQSSAMPTPYSNSGFPMAPGERTPVAASHVGGLVDRRPSVLQSQPRNLILCFDGTAKYFNDGNTNVIRLFQGLDKMRTDSQICYYQPGIGTYVSPTKSVNQISRRASKAIDMAIAWYLDDHIMGGYRFLMDNYREGDKICLFGFSRGAYTARCLAGMLHIVGLLPRGNEEQIPFAYARYKDKSDDGVQKAHGFKKAFSRHVSIEFMGVWDTVTSVGLAGKTLPFTSHNAVVRTFRQAFALDERRAKFRHNPWARAAFDGPAPEAMPEAEPGSDESPRASVGLFPEPILPPGQIRPPLPLSEMLPGLAGDAEAPHADAILSATSDGSPSTPRSATERPPSEAMQDTQSKVRKESADLEGSGVPQPTQGSISFTKWAKKVASSTRNKVRFRGHIDPKHYRADGHEKDGHAKLCPDCTFPWVETNCREVWFIGSHSDVGGGEVDTSQDDHKNNLANPSLLWMIQEIEKLQLGFRWAGDAFVDVPTLNAYFIATGRRAPEPHEPDDLKPLGTVPPQPGKPNPVESMSVVPQPSSIPPIPSIRVPQASSSQPVATVPPQTSSDEAKPQPSPEPKFDSKLPKSVLDELQKDVGGKVHDSLGGATPWWVLEWLPLWKHFLDKKKHHCKELT
ncbi:hypothetical protein FRB90_011321, partial [Tulasnella sp. 427]